MLFELALREDEQIRLGLDGRLVNAKVRVEAQLTHVEQHVQPKANIEDAQEAREWQGNRHYIANQRTLAERHVAIVAEPKVKYLRQDHRQ